MDGEHNVFECLGLHPEKEKQAGPREVECDPSFGTYTDDSVDADIFACLGLNPESLLEKPAPPPKRVRRWAEFEDRWRFEEAYWKAREKHERKWRELSGQTLFFDAPPFPTKEEWLNQRDDPWERAEHSAPHR